MAVLEQVMQLKNQGMDDNQIINSLQQQGISPSEINNALSQAEIKNAVTADNDQPPMPNQNFSNQPMTQEVGQQDYTNQGYAPQNYDQNYNQQNYQESQIPQGEQYYPQEGGYEQGYNEGYEQQGAGFDSSTIMEIAQQVFSEKTKKIDNQLEELNEFKSLNKTKIENIDERLKKIESMIDKLQITILEKVGSYGQNLGEIKKEMNMMQDSFGKMINNVADKNSSTQQTQTPVRKKVSKQ